MWSKDLVGRRLLIILVLNARSDEKENFSFFKRRELDTERRMILFSKVFWGRF